METKSRNGYVVIGGAPYRRSDFVAQPTRFKDWALFSLIMLGLAMAVVLMLVCIGLLAWVGVEAIGAIVRQVQGWR